MVRSRIVPTVDICRIITALGTNASDFGMDGTWLLHRPTRHRFRFAADGRLDRVRCHGWIRVPVNPEDGSRLSEAFAAWKRNYWCARRAMPLLGSRPRRAPQTRDALAILGLLVLAFLVLTGEDQALRHLRSAPGAGSIADAAPPGRDRP